MHKQSTHDYTNEIGKVFGNQAKLNALTHKITEKIRELDEITVEEYIANAIRSQIKELGAFDKGSIRNIRTAYADTQAADIS